MTHFEVALLGTLLAIVAAPTTRVRLCRIALWSGAGILVGLWALFFIVWGSSLYVGGGMYGLAAMAVLGTLAHAGTYLGAAIVILGLLLRLREFVRTT